jgi:hypothetical protein
MLLELYFLLAENMLMTELATLLMLLGRPPFWLILSLSWFPYPNLYGLWSISLSFLRALESSFGGKSLVYEFFRDCMPPKRGLFFSAGRNFLIWEQ